MLVDESTFKLLKIALKKDGCLELPASGNSMFPFIKQGNICSFAPFEPSSLKKGNVILFYSTAGQLIAHRFIKIKIENNQKLFLFKGDTNIGFDPLIREEHILGKLVMVQNQLMKITPEHLIVILWEKIILSFPILSSILQKYVIRKYK